VLLVADFTGQRGGVYWEAGFAQGLGIPVIRTCKSDELWKLHFDTAVSRPGVFDARRAPRAARNAHPGDDPWAPASEGAAARRIRPGRSESVPCWYLFGVIEK
jgi:hypothetical protein